MYLTITYGDKRFSFEGESNVVPEKFGYNGFRTMGKKKVESWSGILNYIDLKISILDEELFGELKLAWQSYEDVYILTENLSEYRISFPESLPSNYTFDYIGKKYYDATMRLEEVE